MVRWRGLGPVTAVVASAAMVLAGCGGSGDDGAADDGKLTVWMMGAGGEAQTAFLDGVEKGLKLNPDAARYLDDPDAYIFSLIADSYVWVDNLLYQEDLARRGQTGHSELYFEALGIRAGNILRERLSRAAEDVGSFWYTAWTVAGRPELK